MKFIFFVQAILDAESVSELSSMASMSGKNPQQNGVIERSRRLSAKD